MSAGTCPAGSHELIASKASCQLAAAELELNDVGASIINNANRPKGCYFKKNKLWFNKKGKSFATGSRLSLCCSVDAVDNVDDDYYDAGDDDGGKGGEPVSICGAGQASTMMSDGVCPRGTHTLVPSEDNCNMAAKELSLADVVATTIKKTNRPKGCYFRKNKLWFNSKGKTSLTSKARQSICCAAAVGQSRAVSSASLAMLPRASIVGGGGGGGGGGDDGSKSISGTTIGATVVGSLVLIVGALGFAVMMHHSAGSSTINVTPPTAADVGVDVDVVVIDTAAAASGNSFEAANFALVGGDVRAISVRRGNPAFVQQA